jgi:hypothetical protein
MYNLFTNYEYLQKRLGYHLYNMYTAPFWKKYIDHVDEIKLQKSSFILSFDCDAEEDYKVVKEMHMRLSDLGIKSTYAVPIQILQRGESEYRFLLENGAVFINHGFRKHTFWDLMKDVNASSFFYDKLPSAVWKEDIYLAHEFLSKFSNSPINGYRTPHFGTFQLKNQIKELHEELKKYDYIYSSSTTPYYLMKKGFKNKEHGIIEIPVTGSFNAPMTILDSWNYFKSPLRKHSPDNYLENISSFIDRFSKSNNLFLNLYADPSHVARSSQFYSAMALLAKSADSLFFEDFISI